MSIRANPGGPIAAYDHVREAIPTVRKQVPYAVSSKNSGDYDTDKPKKSVPKEQSCDSYRNDCCWYFMFTLLLISTLASILALFWTNYNQNGTVGQMTEVLVRYCKERTIYAPAQSEACNLFLKQNM